MDVASSVSESRSSVSSPCSSVSGGEDEAVSCGSLESLLGELLVDIRRSRAGSVASSCCSASDHPGTHTQAQAQAQSRDLDCVYSSFMRSADDLRRYDVAWLEGVARNLEEEAGSLSRVLVRLLCVREKRVDRVARQYERLTCILSAYCKKKGLPTDLKFSLQAPLEALDHQRWLNAWKTLARMRKGIPKHWRKTLWVSIAEHSTREVDWPNVLQEVFSEHITPDDEDLGTQIIKDLHRTGHSGFSSELEHGILKRVLLAFARYNKSIGYCQGFNIMAAQVLKVVDFEEDLALKVLVHLIEHLIPENYFSQNLYALSADMDVLRELMSYHLPNLTAHVERLRGSQLDHKSYSSDNPPSFHSYEPPLIDVFTVQWFLTAFANSLPKRTVLRLWDTLFLEGSEVTICAALAVWSLLKKKLLTATNTADFYTSMAAQSEQLKNGLIVSSFDFMQAVYEVFDSTPSSPCFSASSSSSTSSFSTTKSDLPSVSELRRKYTYAVCPLEPVVPKTKCPFPSSGGSYAFGKAKDLKSEQLLLNGNDSGKSDESGDSSSACVTEKNSVKEQVRLLQTRYARRARMPELLSCEMELSSPFARVSCPQAKRSVVTLGPPPPVYAADVPVEVKQQSACACACDTRTLEYLKSRRVFALSYFHPAVYESSGGNNGHHQHTPSSSYPSLSSRLSVPGTINS